MRQRFLGLLHRLRLAIVRVWDAARRDPLPAAGGATALLGIVLLVAARGHAVPLVPGVGSHPSRGKVSVIYYPPRPAVGHTEYTPSPTSVAVTPPVVAQPLAPQWPVTGMVVQGYGWAYDRLGGYWYFHTGWDIRGFVGEAVRAAMGGTVEAVAASPLLGETVTVKTPGGLLETYAGLGAADVATGQGVVQGEQIGTLSGAIAGEQDGVHLHFAIERGGQPVDPDAFLPAP